MKINYCAPICSTGYGYAGFNICRQLIEAGAEVILFPIGNSEQSMISELSSKYFPYNNITLDKNISSVRIFHQNDVHHRIGAGKHYGFPIFELDTFNRTEIASMSLCDELIVCSEWARSIIHKYLPEKTVHLVPLGIDTDIFSPCLMNSTENTIFLTVGKWEIRKGHDFIIDNFNKAFNESDKVELWMLCHNPFLEDGGMEWINKCRYSKLASKIKIIPRQSTHDNVYYIMSKADVGLFPARAEGWNLELLEMMSIGKTVITTNYSAHTEFCNNSNSLLIQIDELEKAVDNIWFHGNGNWSHLGENQSNQFIDHLRNTHKNKQEKSLTINNAGINTGRLYTWRNSAKCLIKALE